MPLIQKTRRLDRLPTYEVDEFVDLFEFDCTSSQILSTRKMVLLLTGGRLIGVRYLQDLHRTDSCL